MACVPLPWLLNAAGLLLSLIGAVTIWRFGLPQPDFDDSVAIGAGELPDDHKLPSGETYGDMVRRVAREKERYSALSRAGLGLIIIGFALQLASAVISMPR